MKTIEQRAIEACIRYDEKATEVARASKAISEALQQCPRSDIFGGHEWRSHIDEAWKSDLHHLDIGVDGVDAAQARIIGSCPACTAALAAIMERKRLNKQVGAAKRQIRAIAKAARAQDCVGEDHP